MKVSKIFQAAVLGAAALSMGTGGAFAVCSEFGGFAIFQCADLAYIEPVPEPVTLGPDDGSGRLVVGGATAIFWQAGFGNATLESGLGSTGTGNSGLTTFNGNDRGLGTVELAEASSVDSRMPVGALCLRNNNFGNFGVDGCCDNDRGTTLIPNNDDILNPLYHVYYSRNGYPGVYSRDWDQDYPVAALVKTASGKWFAAMMVSSMDRGNNGDAFGPCHPTSPGTNPAACDFRAGFFTYKDVANANLNSVTGAMNAVPWQMVPRPRAFCISGCTGVVTRTINFNWNAAKWHHDNINYPTSHPQMAPALADRAAGVAPLDLLTKSNATNNWRGLIRYNLQRATVTAGNLDPNGAIMFSTLSFANVVADIPQPLPLGSDGNPTGTVVQNSVSSPPDTCYRVQVLFGKKPETLTTTTANCRLGKCGDRGYTAESLDPGVITCIGGSLLAEEIRDASVTRTQGSLRVQWRTSSEVAVQKFDLYAETARGEKFLVDRICNECNTGAGSSYDVTLRSSSVKGAKAIVIEMVSGNGNVRTRVPIQ
jgi:hypothetical protein